MLECDSSKALTRGHEKKIPRRAHRQLLLYYGAESALHITNCRHLIVAQGKIKQNYSSNKNVLGYLFSKHFYL